MASDCPLVFIPADSNHNCTCTQPAGHVEQGKPHICPECGAFTLASERRAEAHAAEAPDGE